MTQWVENPSGGRDTGPVALARAWMEVTLRPRRFFRTGIAPGDQAPGLVFAAAVVLVEELSRIALVTEAYPVLGGQPIASRALWLALAVVLVTPAVIHLVAALQTLLLMAVTADRAGVSETVQVLGYATAPCLLAGLPVPALRLACCLYGSVLLVVGLTTVHDLSLPRGVLAGGLPAALLFGYGFRGFAAAEAVLGTVT